MSVAGSLKGAAGRNRELLPNQELMGDGEMQEDNKRVRSVSKLRMWIIEYVWTHRMMDIQEVVEPIRWSDMDALSLEDSVRLRVASAQVYSIVKKRDVEHYGRVMAFLESTHRLLPGLVAPIKHMKIMFGLKTMVIMWMLRAGGGVLETVSKILEFFPSKLPQYQDQCNQRDMFLMRKNHLDFKTLAQTLAMDKDKLGHYVENHMDEQYGEHYAQRVEDRLLSYLHQLDTLLPGETYIDKILKKSSPATEEEKLLLEVVTCDSITIATTLKKLLHCDLASFHPGSSERTVEEMRQRSKEPPSSPHFCSKHQRWVKSILQECPDEELLLQANLSLSPPLFHSSSSTSSSQDLTPSNLVPGPSDQPPPSQARGSPMQASHRDTCGGQQPSGSARTAPQKEPPPYRDVLVPALSSPVVRLVDIGPVTRSCATAASHQPPASRDQRAASVSTPQEPGSSESSVSPPSPSAQPATPSSVLPGNHMPPSSELSRRHFPLNSSTRSPQTQTSPPSTAGVPPDHQGTRLDEAPGPGPRSPLLQPFVSITRLSLHDCCVMTEGRCSISCDCADDADSSFDPNTLYSSPSSGSDSSDSTDHDPDYKPCIKKKRLLLEYEAVRSRNQF